MPQVLNDVVKAVWRVVHTTPNTIIENVYAWKITDLVDGADVDCGAEIISELIAMYTGISALFADRYVLQDVRITNETQKTFVFDGDGVGFTGSGGAGEVLPAQDAALVLARSKKLGHQGRKYLGPLLENVSENGIIGAGAQALLVTFAGRWDSAFTGAGTGNEYTPGTVKYAPGGAVQTFTAFDTDSSKILTEVRTQRRRRPGVGLS